MSVPNDPTTRSDAALLSCAAAPGGWTAGGTVHNPTKRRRTYILSVDFTSPHFTDLGFASTRVDVAPGKTVNWSVAAQFNAVAGTRCILRGVASDT